MKDLLDLKSLRKPLEATLQVYNSYLGLDCKFQDFPDFALTPDKPNYARTIVPVIYGKKNVGDLYAIVFCPGDGTGDNKTYHAEDLVIPQELQYQTKPERVFPRAKEGVIYEGFFPFFSIKDKKDPSYFTSHLELLTVHTFLPTPREICNVSELGIKQETEFLDAVKNSKCYKPEVTLTVGNRSFSNSRFGDPHAIYYPPIKGCGDVIQVAGFLAIKDTDNPFLSVAEDKWNIPVGF
jgi:hypothetical protein